MVRPKLNKTPEATEGAESTEQGKRKFPYIPFTDSESLPQAKTDAKGKFLSYGEPHYAYRRTSANTAELLAIYRKPTGIVTKQARRLKLRSGVNKDDAFYRLIKENNIPELD